ncbi:MAG: hypothetical protein KKB30_03155 [Proteobacteria bacterium]|nr:hypothetical protein [Pseudomonadota bacterium]MBU1716100.1 hypothetical protein [Pseudomonadota bacterium]
MNKCFSCGNEVGTGKPGRGDTCPTCDADLRVCRNCKFFEQAVYNECAEPQAERVVDKERANFCDYFVFGGEGQRAAASQQDEALKKLNALFGGS